jgi:hypothetical protein
MSIHIVAATARKFERVKAFVIEHRQEHVTVSKMKFHMDAI